MNVTLVLNYLRHSLYVSNFLFTEAQAAGEVLQSGHKYIDWRILAKPDTIFK